ncbi:hypothetical protein H8F21_15065 [Pseudomonas sp. P66]|uniref:Lipoprotein n=1 Tax=Pseudomonas arcuscaelestis TaxID=2710591 RepID=A0ABS2BZL2_9PSED|nr:hypothetical protein [Pseudomonas arcuscaelestis]MBM5458885.1 hypothetical protein [Pseudomonas arcuscaelestis]
MKRFASLLLPLLLTGCGESINGAYQAAIQYADEQPRPVGLAIIQHDKIIADGRSVAVAEWKHDGSTYTAFDAEGKRLAQLVRNDAGDLVQSLPMSRVVYRKFEF